MQVELVSVTASGRVQPHEIGPGRYVIGRGKDCTLRVPSAEVSRHHCELSVGQSQIIIRDLDSSNGTWVNTERIGEAELAAGDLIAVGPLVLVVRIDGEPENIDPVLLYEQGRPRQSSSKPGPSEPMTRPSLLDDEGIAPTDDADASSVVEFEFDLNDDSGDQPPL